MGIIEQLGGLEAIREKVSCPEFGDNYYGEWGALTLEQRRVIAALVGRVEYLDELCRAMQNAHSKADDFMYAEKLEKLEERA